MKSTCVWKLKTAFVNGARLRKQLHMRALLWLLFVFDCRSIVFELKGALWGFRTHHALTWGSSHHGSRQHAPRHAGAGFFAVWRQILLLVNFQRGRESLSGERVGHLLWVHLFCLFQKAWYLNAHEKDKNSESSHTQRRSHYTRKHAVNTLSTRGCHFSRTEREINAQNTCNTPPPSPDTQYVMKNVKYARMFFFWSKPSCAAGS